MKILTVLIALIANLLEVMVPNRVDVLPLERFYESHKYILPCCPSSKPNRGHALCSWTFYSHSASLLSGVQMGTDELNAERPCNVLASHSGGE